MSSRRRASPRSAEASAEGLSHLPSYASAWSRQLPSAAIFTTCKIGVATGATTTWPRCMNITLQTGNRQAENLQSVKRGDGFADPPYKSLTLEQACQASGKAVLPHRALQDSMQGRGFGRTRARLFLCFLGRRRAAACSAACDSSST